MKKFSKETGIAAPMDRANVDTDQIIPKQYLKSIKRTGFGKYLFDEWRYLDAGLPDEPCDHRRLNPDFVLNEPRYKGASILVARQNFGCGSSREHAPWALEDYGFRCVIAPSFADIFYNNCFKNGILPIILDEKIVEQLLQAILAQPGYQLAVDLEAQTIIQPNGNMIRFEIDQFRKQRLLLGLDDIGETLQEAPAIAAFEKKHQQTMPWLFGLIK
jgi:3-isopropylmalate/(R)-2-methylmalate dehydratase small subunit